MQDEEVEVCIEINGLQLRKFVSLYPLLFTSEGMFLTNECNLLQLPSHVTRVIMYSVKKSGNISSSRKNRLALLVNPHRDVFNNDLLEMVI